ncbi:unnamed protein product [Arabidopsis halleri]
MIDSYTPIEYELSSQSSIFVSKSLYRSLSLFVP